MHSIFLNTNVKIRLSNSNIQQVNKLSCVIIDNKLNFMNYISYIKITIAKGMGTLIKLHKIT